MLSKNLKILLLAFVLAAVPAISFGKISYSRTAQYQSKNSNYSQSVRRKTGGIYCKCIISAGKRVCYIVRQ